jgi:organic hydroperoxide reductase OsmC/OhrA
MTAHRYAVRLRWTGNHGTGTSGYRDYSRNHTVTTEGRPDLLGSADPTFRGDRDRWNPEQLLLAALAQCHLMSYLHVCVTEGVVVTAYADSAEASMVVDRDGSGRFTEAVLRPVVTIAEESMRERAVRGHHRANELCFIANSVSFPVRHEPTTHVAG